MATLRTNIVTILVQLVTESESEAEEVPSIDGENKFSHCGTHARFYDTVEIEGGGAHQQIAPMVASMRM